MRKMPHFVKLAGITSLAVIVIAVVLTIILNWTLFKRALMPIVGGGYELDKFTRDSIVKCSIGFSVAINLIVGTVLFLLVYRSRLHPFPSILIYIALSVCIAFLPGKLMTSIASAIGHEFLFAGDAGWVLLLTPFFMFLFSGAAVIVYIICICVNIYFSGRPKITS